MNTDQLASEASMQISVFRNRALKGDETIDSVQQAIIKSAIEKATEGMATPEEVSAIARRASRAARASEQGALLEIIGRIIAAGHYYGEDEADELEKTYHAALSQRPKDKTI